MTKRLLIGLLGICACISSFAENTYVSAAKRVDDFYHWYLSEKSPIFKEEMLVYVDATLWKKVKAGTADLENQDTDYFLKVQDNPDDWVKFIDITAISETPKQAFTKVCLGQDKAPDSWRSCFKVTSKKDKQHAWKITGVKQISGPR